MGNKTHFLDKRCYSLKEEELLTQEEVDQLLESLKKDINKNMADESKSN